MSLDEQGGRPAATRLYAILAREARTAVIFRRGPSKQVQLILWDLRTDTFEHGQWIKGRVYERRCDLSPSGRLLIYFVATNRPPHGSWSAISRPPFFTALAMWPKGDAWGGGGMFEDEKTLLLNHRPASDDDRLEPAAGFRLAPKMRVRPFGRGSGGGEDDPIHSTLRQRDGWRIVDEGEGRFGDRKTEPLYVFSRPRVTEKDGQDGYRLQETLHTLGRRESAWYGQDHRVIHRNGRSVLHIAGTDWADWDGGDLVFARDGCLFRLRQRGFADFGRDGKGARLLHDFTTARFAPLAPTPDALRY